MVKVKEEVLDFDQSDTLLTHDEFDVHRQHYGNNSEDEIYYQTGKYNRGQFSFKNSNNKQFFGCGSNNHCLRDCPSISRNSTSRNKQFE